MFEAISSIAVTLLLYLLIFLLDLDPLKWFEKFRSIFRAHRRLTPPPLPQSLPANNVVIKESPHGDLMQPSRALHFTLHNTTGPTYDAIACTFPGCDPRHISGGAPVTVGINGTIVLQRKVQVADDGTLYVTLPPRDQLLNFINSSTDIIPPAWLDPPQRPILPP